MHIQHLLAVNDVLISLRLALPQAQSENRLVDFRIYRGDPKPHRLTVQVRDVDGRRRDISAIPDAVLVVQPVAGPAGVFFIEVDRGTMSTARWQEKVMVYREYSQSVQLQERWHSSWAILLTVTLTERRLLSIAEKTVAIGGRRGFWFTTAEKIEPSTVLNPVWVKGSSLFELRNERVSKLGNVKLAPQYSLLDVEV
jgi:hypothetical protein